MQVLRLRDDPQRRRRFEATGLLPPYIMPKKSWVSTGSFQLLLSGRDVDPAEVSRVALLEYDMSDHRHHKKRCFALLAVGTSPT